MDSLSDRMYRWYMSGFNLKRMLLHPDDLVAAKRLHPDLMYNGLPIEFL